MILAILAGFILSLIIVFFGSYIKGQKSIILALVPLALFSYFVYLLNQISESSSILFHYEWVKSLGIHLDFQVDGLSLLFALMITGVGTLVFVYTAYYLKEHRYLDRFYGYLSMFMGAMLGLVFSDNLITLFIFWELTSISSFFLIGFNNQDEASRKSALTALAITGLGGLFLLAAALLMGYASDSYSISAILSSGVELNSHELYVPIIICVFLAAFTKSAQFPFHFWLPGAMKAPTPVSTYLHSATMVKAGIYLLLRLSPILNGHDFWHITLTVVGAITMLYAAFHTLFRTDLKGILAYSTIAALGILVLLIGMGTSEALLAALVFIVVHALYKAALFLITGIIDHQAGTRDISQLAGLGKFMIPVAVAGFIAAFSNAGIPLFVGFIGKDLIYEASLHLTSFSWLITIAFVITNILLLYAGFLAGIKPFIGKTPEKMENTNAPSPLLYMPTLVLGFGSLIFGLAPLLLQNTIINHALGAVGFGEFDFQLKIWHGFNIVLALSGLTIVAGLVLFFTLKPTQGKLDFINKFEKISPKSIIEWLAKSLKQLANFYTQSLQHGYLRNYVLLILIYFICLVGYQLIFRLNFDLHLDELSKLTFYEVSILSIMMIAIIFTISSKSRLAAVAAMGVVGYSMCLIFMFYSAPDLALTQFLIDTLTVILFVLVLYRLPRYLNLTEPKTKFRDGIVAISVGALICIIALAVLDQTVSKEVGDYYADNAYVLAKGKNVVNVILVDFRGLDTLVEGIVLSIAAIGVFGLMKLRIGDKDNNLID